MRDPVELRREALASERNRMKVELAAKSLRITGLEETLRQTVEQLIRVKNSDPEIRNHDLWTDQVIVRARRMLS